MVLLMPSVLIALMSPPEAAPTFGYLPPVFSFSEEVRKRGYNVVWCCSEGISPRVASAYRRDRIRTYPDPTFLGTPRIFQPLFSRILSTDIPQRMLPKLDDQPNHEWLFDSYVTVGFHVERFFFAALETILGALVEFEPDFMFTYGCPVGLTAAHISGVPVATIDNLMRLRNEGGNNYRRMDDTVQKAIDLYSPFEEDYMPLEDIIRNNNQFRIIYTIKHLGRNPYLENEFFVGGFEPSKALSVSTSIYTPPQIDSNSRNVFAYFGSASISFQLIRKILPQVFEEVNRLCTTPYDCYVGSQYVDEPYSLGTVHFAPFFDMSKIITHATYVFSHGGINTIMQALGYGVPLLMVPGSIYERRHNAKEVAAVNSGVLVEIEDFTVPHLSSLLLDQAQERELRRYARYRQQLIVEAGGIQKAFDTLEDSWLTPYDKSRLSAVAQHLHYM